MAQVYVVVLYHLFVSFAQGDGEVFCAGWEVGGQQKKQAKGRKLFIYFE